MNQLTISSRITPNPPENIPKSLEFIVSFVTVMVPGQQAREITLKPGDLKSKSRWPTKRFRAIGRSLSLSADPLIDLFDLTAGGGVTKRPQDSQSSDLIVYLSRRIRKYPSILESKTERRQAFGGSLVTTSTRIVAIKFTAESNCRVDFASKVIDQQSRFRSLLSVFFFFFDQIRLNRATSLSLSLFFFSRPSLFQQTNCSVDSLPICLLFFSRRERKSSSTRCK